MNCPLPNEIIEKALNASGFNIDEIRGGISKQVYKITTQTESFILYVWLRPYDGTLTENQTKGMEYLFPDGFKYFLHNIKLLSDIGVRVPHIISAGHYDDGDFDYAIVECFKGQSLDDYMRNDGDVGALADRITAVMNKMAVKKRDYYGSPIETKPNNISAAQLIFNFYAEELNIASKFDNKVNAIQSKILRLMQSKMSEIVETKAQEFSLVHGELTPPHIFILDNGEIGLIDIEGVKYFDSEYDWTVMDFMYAGKIPLPDNINKQKLDFYKICLKVGYLSISSDYLVHVDKNNEVFKSIRKSNLRDLGMMI